MTYQVLARKWRPKRFADLVGQEHVVKALVNALDKGRLHHAYLLTGTRGVGKTTIARILAKSLNCPHVAHGEPCGQCESCLQIDAGRYVDVLEIDAASNTGIDNIREVLENAQYAPTMGKYKVYIIDEVHMLSKSAFNAMLKTLEEPPEHVKFILATTDPQKVPITVLSRCLQFVLRNLNGQQVHDHLAHVLQTEQIDYEDTALHLLGRAAAGSMRDALSLLDQAIAIGSGVVTEADVRHMIGAVDKRYLYDLLGALAARDGEALMAQAAQMASRAIGFDNALSELAMLLQRLALLQAVPDAIGTDDPERDTLRALATLFSGEQIQLYYQCALRGKQDLPLAPDEYAGFTMTLLRMLAFAPMAAAGQPQQGSVSGTQLHDGDATNQPAPVSSMADNSPAHAATSNTAAEQPEAAPQAENSAMTNAAAQTVAVSSTADNQSADIAENAVANGQIAPQRVDNVEKTAGNNATSATEHRNNNATSAYVNESTTDQPSEQPAAPVSKQTPMQDRADAASAPTPPPWDVNETQLATAVTQAKGNQQTETAVAATTTAKSTATTVQPNTATLPENTQQPARGLTKANAALPSTEPTSSSAKTVDSQPSAAAPERLSSPEKTNDLPQTVPNEFAESSVITADSQSTKLNEPDKQTDKRVAVTKKAAAASSKPTKPADNVANTDPAVAYDDNNGDHNADPTDDMPQDLPPLAAANWVDILAQLAHKLGALQLFSQHTAIVSFDAESGELTLALAPQGEATADKTRLARLAAILSAAYQQPIHVHTQAWQDNPSWETPAMYQQRRVQETRAEAQQLLEADATAQALISTFSATWVPESLILNTAENH